MVPRDNARDSSGECMSETYRGQQREPRASYYALCRASQSARTIARRVALDPLCLRDYSALQERVLRDSFAEGGSGGL